MNNAMNQISHEQIIEQLPAYSLGILEPEWVAIVEKHLETCPSCPIELASLQAVTTALALSAPEIAAPAGARERFASMLAAESKGSQNSAPLPTQTNAPARQPVTPASQPRRAAATTAVVAPVRRWWESFSPFAWGAAVAFALLLLVVGVWGLGQRSANEQAQQQIANLQPQVQQLQTQVAQATADNAEQQQAIALLGGTSAQAVALTATNGSGVNATAKLWVDPATNHAVLITQNLAPAPDGKVYELWLIDQAPVAIDVFNTEDAASGAIVFTLPTTSNNFTVAAITVEQSKVDAPTTKPILAGNIS